MHATSEGFLLVLKDSTVINYSIKTTDFSIT